VSKLLLLPVQCARLHIRFAFA